jgi:hypothetical protein
MVKEDNRLLIVCTKQFLEVMRGAVHLAPDRPTNICEGPTKEETKANCNNSAKKDRPTQENGRDGQTNHWPSEETSDDRWLGCPFHQVDRAVTTRTANGIADQLAINIQTGAAVSTGNGNHVDSSIMSEKVCRRSVAEGGAEPKTTRPVGRHCSLLTLFPILVVMLNPLLVHSHLKWQIQDEEQEFEEAAHRFTS